MARRQRRSKARRTIVWPMLAGSGNGGGLDGHGRRGERDAGQAEGALEVLCKLVRDSLVSVQDTVA